MSPLHYNLLGGVMSIEINLKSLKLVFTVILAPTPPPPQPPSSTTALSFTSLLFFLLSVWQLELSDAS
jgi:hypothetical protein